MGLLKPSLCDSMELKGEGERTEDEEGAVRMCACSRELQSMYTVISLFPFLFFSFFPPFFPLTAARKVEISRSLCYFLFFEPP